MSIIIMWRVFLTILLGGSNLATALVEFELKGPAAKEFEHPSITAKKEKKFSRPDALPNAGFAPSKYEALEGEKDGKVMIDVGTGKLSSATLAEPVIPGKGKGNRLLWSVGTSHDDGHGPLQDHRKLSDVAVDAVKSWIEENNNYLDIDVAELGEERSGVHSGGEHVQVIIFRTHHGVSVDGSLIHAEISQGNIISFATEEWADISSELDTTPTLSAADAMEAVASFTGYAKEGGGTCEPELKIIAVSASHHGHGNEPTRSLLRGERRKIQEQGQGQGPKFGEGYTHKLIWEVCPTLEGQTIERFVAKVDAHDGEVLEFRDSNDYLEAKGGVYPKSNDGVGEDGNEQAGWPMPFMTIGGSTTDVGGNFEVGSGAATFEGPYLNINDNCGSSSLPVSGVGIDWGTSGGTDCTTPGFGGAGNTHSSRTAFYEVNTISDQARGRLPTNNWLTGKLQANININSSCNAFWSGSINFYRSGGSCANTGELAAVLDHEWGHGLDNNDMIPTISQPSGEGIADVYAALRLGDSCIGRNFLSTPCGGNGNPCTSCTGVRDIDYLARLSGEPQTYSWSNQNCGGSVHCIGNTYAQAIWSLWKRKLPEIFGYDDNTALEVVTRLTYIAAGATSTWFSGGPPYGGCGGSSGYMNFLAADDDNGNLNDGTPHMTAIFEAFNDQEIACETPSVQNSGCQNNPDTQPIVTTIPGNSSVRLEWQAVGFASGYEVLRSDGGVHGCKQGKKLLTASSDGTNTDTTTTNLFYEDSGLQNGREYCYIVVPKGSSASCYGPASASTLVTPALVPAYTIICPSQGITFERDSPGFKIVTCTITSVYGYSGSLNLETSTQMSGITSTIGQQSVQLADEPQDIQVTVTSSTQVNGGSVGFVTVSADDGSGIVRSSDIIVTIQAGDGPQIATFDENYKVPRCSAVGSSCSTQDSSGGSILNGRGSVGPEQDASNTLDSCTDGSSGEYHVDESLDAITIRDGSLFGQPTQNLSEGATVTIEALVWCWSNGQSDWADFYYAADASNPDWQLIGTKGCPSGGKQTLSMEYTLPEGATQAVRVNFRYMGSQSACSGGSWDDADDLVFPVSSGTSSFPPPPPPTVAPTSSPTTVAPSRSPTNDPTSSPTKQPSKAPTSDPTSSPTTAAPSRSPTNDPTSSPTKQPSKAPTSDPTSSPTSAAPSRSPTNDPTSSPTKQPSNAPTSASTSSPTSAAPSKSPTNDPTSAAPTALPTFPPSAAPTSQPTLPPSAATSVPSETPTNQPTSPPTIAPSSIQSTAPTGVPSPAPSQPPTQANDGPQIATFDENYKVPRCSAVGSSCSTQDSSGSSILNGRGSVGPEQDASNTLDSCTDGSSGEYHVDESIDAITIRDGSLFGQPTQNLLEGATVTIEALVWCWDVGSSDWADFYYAADASNPDWQLIGTKGCPSGGKQTLSMEYTLPEGATQAVRVNFRYMGSQSACSGGSWDDADDLVFPVSSGTSSFPPPAPPSSSAPTSAPTSSPTSAAPSRSPTNDPTSSPTKQPSKAPTSDPTSSPTTAAPSRSPTNDPTSSPTKQPSKAPTSLPTEEPTTTAPSKTPTAAPTNPFTLFPTSANLPTNPTPTKDPSLSPTTAAPTSQPTLPPTLPPTSEPSLPPTATAAVPQEAVFDEEYGIPRCVFPGSACDSGSLLDGKGTMLNGVEPNQPNTNKKGIECADGNSGTYHNDESIDAIIVTAGEIDGSGAGGYIVEGGRATVSAKVWCWDNGSSDTADIYHTSDASNPASTWVLLASIVCPGGGEQTLQVAFDVPPGINQMVRVNFRYNGEASTCSEGGYDDHDDLGFTVKQGGNAPTPSGAQFASFDQALGVPKCAAGSSCNTTALLDGRGNIGPETNQPNVLKKACNDGASGTYHTDESIDNIVVSSASGDDLTEGEVAIVTAQIWCWGDGKSDFVDFYYASSATDPVWNFIERKQCPGGNSQNVSTSYTLPQGAVQAIRVNLMYGETDPIDNCASGDFNDIDDLAITVRPKPTVRSVPIIPNKLEIEGGVVRNGDEPL